MGNFFEGKNFDCSDYDSEKNISCEMQIGYTIQSYHKIIFLVFSSIGVVFAIIFFFDYLIYKIRKLRTSKNRNSGSMKLFFRILSILDFLTSLYWLLSSAFLPTIKDIKVLCINKKIFLFPYLNRQLFYV